MRYNRNNEKDVLLLRTSKDMADLSPASVDDERRGGLLLRELVMQGHYVERDTWVHMSFVVCNMLHEQHIAIADERY